MCWGQEGSAVLRLDKEPHSPVNVAGKPRQVMRTLMAKIQSCASCPREAGAVSDAGAMGWTEPSPAERKCMLGYAPGCTAAPGVSDQQRHATTGRCMDAFVGLGLRFIRHLRRIRMYAVHTAYSVGGLAFGAVDTVCQQTVCTLSWSRSKA
jgi:hypothetical protein